MHSFEQLSFVSWFKLTCLMKQLLDLCTAPIQWNMHSTVKWTSCQLIYRFFQSCLLHGLFLYTQMNIYFVSLREEKRFWSNYMSRRILRSFLRTCLNLSIVIVYTWIEIWKHLWNSVASKMASKTCWYKNKSHRINHARNEIWNIFYRQEKFHFYIRSNYLKYW